MNLGVLYYMTQDKEDKKKTNSDRVAEILKEYEKKYGKPPVFLGMSVKNKEDIKLPSDVKIVVHRVHIPLNHVWVEL